ncbi:hypothetical protein EIP86_006088 [Pleurotus ostreatoroseus]|nr:hypothetical protein EIP86_006088 [Pleurotus ostreatoroseus]
MDVRELKFDPASFDVAIDKGTMDAMMTAKGDVWDPPEEVIENCTREVDEVLRRYANKVKHITLGTTPPDLTAFEGHILPNLISVTLCRDGCLSSASWILSNQLRDLDVDMRAASDSKASRARAANVADVLLVQATQNSLLKFKIRGWMTPVLDSTVRTLVSLRSLTLYTGKSLTPQTLASLASFPNLEQLSVHASHIDSSDFASALPVDSTTFPVLHTLRIRGQRALFCALLEALPTGNLRSLYLETEEPEQGLVAWRETFDLLVAKASDTLIDFTLDQILELEEMEDTIAHTESDTRLAAETLQPLGKLRALRRFTIDAMILPDFTDKDIDHIASWWPLLEQLNLGTLPGMQEHAQPWVPKVTIAALMTIAKRCPHLESLTLPLDISAGECDPSNAVKPKNDTPQAPQNALRKLYVGHAGTSDYIPQFLRSVLKIFPKLLDLECITIEKTVSLDARLGASLQGQQDQGERSGVTLDGYADGQ